MFNQTFQAMDTMDLPQSSAELDVKTNNDMLRGQLADQMKRISSERQVTGRSRRHCAVTSTGTILR